MNWLARKLKLLVGRDTTQKYNRGSMSIEHCASDEVQYEFKTKEEAQKLISDWDASKLPIESNEIQDWIKACENHMGWRHVDYVKRYYPEYSNKRI